MLSGETFYGHIRQYFLESQLKVKHFLAQIFELEPHSDFADYLFIQILGVSPYLLLYI